MIQAWILRLLLVAIGLPILMCLLFGLSYLLAALGDDGGSVVVVRTNLALGVLWVFDILLLVIALAFAAVVDSAPVREETIDELVTEQADEDR